MENQDIYSFIISEENKFKTDQIDVGENWKWNFKDHVQMIFHLINSKFFTGENDWLRAFKQLIRPLIRLSIWTEDLEVKDVTFFIENNDDRALSFLVKKYHDEVYVREHDLDTLFDEITESDLTYGGVVNQKGEKRPETIPLLSIAFCDQTDILGGPIAFKHYFSPDKLREMSKAGWGEESNGATISLEDLCRLASFEKDSGNSGNKNKVPGKTIEVYILRGNLPESYLKDGGDTDYYCNQVQVVALYTDKDNKKQGVTLYRQKEEEGNLKFFCSEKIHNRALGASDGEAHIQPQIWSNFLEIHKMNLLESASKVPLVTDDSSYTNKNKIQDMENLEITTIEEGKTIRQVPTAATANIQLMSNEINSWYETAQLGGAAFDSIMGKEESSGTTFKGQERLVAQGRGWHDRRRGQRAKYIEEIYRDWIIPDIIKEITKGKKFLATLSTEEMSWVADQVATTLTNRRIKDMILEGKMVTPEEQQAFTQIFKQEFLKKGNKRVLEILKDEFKGIELKIGINVAGKQKNLAGLSDKILSVVQFALANPMAVQNAGMAKPINDILEYSGLNPVDFAALSTATPSPMQPTMQPTMAQPTLNNG